MSQSAEACQTCPAHQGQLVRLGLRLDGYDYLVALAGNPNTGKSTVFNALTGLRQHTGNWPGKTVARAEGAFLYGGKRYKLVDLPGTYSLLSTSTDEEVARDFILFGKPDVTLIVADATRLERNLNLVLQILEITDRAVLCLNLMDEAKRHGLLVDPRALARDLGVPVVPAAARQGQGIPELLQTMQQLVEGRLVCRPHRLQPSALPVNEAVQELCAHILSRYPELPNVRWVALRLLEGDQRIIDALKNGELGLLERTDNRRSVMAQG